MQKVVLNEHRELMQRIELEMLRELKPILDRNHIPFTLAFGTALGCVRHQGFIPWDDDTDIQIFAEDLPRLLKVFEEQDTGHLRLDYFTSVENYPFVFPKIVDTRTLLLEEKNAYTGYRGGVFIDVFPLYSMPKSAAARWLLIKRQLLRSYMVRAHCYPVSTLSPVLRLPGLLIRLFTSQKKLQRRYHNTLIPSKLRGDQCLSGFSFSLCNIHDRRIFEDIVDMPFEDAMMPMMRDTDTYLRTEYGADYMTPPPEDRRGTVHFISKLDVSEWLRQHES